MDLIIVFVYIELFEMDEGNLIDLSKKNLLLAFESDYYILILM